MNPTTMCGQCAYVIIDIQLYVSPPADMSERGCPRKTSLIWFVFVGLSAGGKSLISWGEPHDQP